MEAAAPDLHQAALDEVIALATDLCRRIHAEATGANPAITLEQAATSLDRAARIVRRTVLLSRRLHTLRPPAAQGAADRTRSRVQVIRQVENAIHRAAVGEKRDPTPLLAELDERLDRPDFEYDILSRPLEDVIQEIREDLDCARQGRAYTFPRRNGEDLDRLLRRAADPCPDPTWSLGP